MGNHGETGCTRKVQFNVRGDPEDGGSASAPQVLLGTVGQNMGKNCWGLRGPRILLHTLDEWVFVTLTKSYAECVNGMVSLSMESWTPATITL